MAAKSPVERREETRAPSEAVWCYCCLRLGAILIVVNGFLCMCMCVDLMGLGGCAVIEFGVWWVERGSLLSRRWTSMD